MNCANCKFYLADEALCRANPPTPVFVPTINQVVAFFPPMTPAGWCGKHEEIKS